MTDIVNLPIDGSIICHSWNKDRTQIAVSANSKDVCIFSRVDNKWNLIHTLTEHTSKVLGIDWAPNSNRILTCGADKNAYVWNFDGKIWRPDLVILRINRAATCCKWSPSEKKFAIGCGLRCICICYYERNQEFWVSKHIKKPLKSTILCLDWHPNSILIAAGGADYKCRVYCAYIEDVDGPSPQSNLWGNNKFNTYAECLAEYGTTQTGWIHSVAFNFAGNRLAWVGHDSCLHVVDAQINPKEIITMKTAFLPFLSIVFISNSTLVAVGHDCYPVVFQISNKTINVLEKLTVGQTALASKNQNSAFDKFRNVDRLKTEAVVTNDQSTVHQNSIKQVTDFNKNNGNTSKISTCGLDGLVVVWDLEKLENQFGGLRIK